MYTLSYEYGNPAVTVYLCTVASIGDAKKIAKFCEALHLAKTPVLIQPMTVDTLNFEEFISRLTDDKVVSCNPSWKDKKHWQQAWGRKTILQEWRNVNASLNQAIGIMETYKKQGRNRAYLDSKNEVDNYKGQLEQIRPAYDYYIANPDMEI